MDSVHKRKPKEFVAELFDSFGNTFDKKCWMGWGIKYQSCGWGSATKSLRYNHGSILDAGCGTGLAGIFLKPLVDDVMIDVDASQKMLDVAAKCSTNK
mmetsp:Transcript_10740/g.12677  ORF Transcript_10740/g.12677 Transcript_10740/m.12677 type:complete len:98 (-) Transcript_10740:66-359(-)